VAVLKGGDYERAEELREEFQNALADLRNDPALDPWERISASEGLARFDAVRDRGVDDLFRHADNDMYVRKRASKGYQ